MRGTPIDSTTPARSYFDHAATTPLRPEALEAMLPFLTDNFANPSGAHAESRRARIALDDGREYLIRDGFAYTENRSIHLDDSGRRPRLRDKR